MSITQGDDRRRTSHNDKQDGEGEEDVVVEKQPVVQTVVSFCSCGMYEPVNVYSSPSGYRNSNCKHCGGSPRT